MSVQEQYENILEVRNKGFSDLIGDARERGAWQAVRDFAEAKTGGFRVEVILLYVLSYISHPILWALVIATLAVDGGVSYPMSLVLMGIFGANYFAHKDINRKLLTIRDVLPMVRNQAEFVEYGLAEGKEVKPEYDDDLAEATEALAENLREEGIEVWHVDGNKVVCERGCFVGFPYEESPEDKEVTHVY